MHGTTPEKLVRLSSYLFHNPKELGRYLAYCRSAPLHARVPWFSWPAIDFLNGYLRGNMTVFEFGSGGSTLFFGERVSRVTSVEDNGEWHDVIEAEIKRQSKKAIEYRFESSNVGEYESTPYVQALDRPYDVIVVDGSEEWPDQTVRPVCFWRAERFVAPGGIIVLDDSWRYEKLNLGGNATTVQRFQGVGPGRFGVTSTDIFFY